MAPSVRKKATPPYMPYRTFSNWLAGQRTGVPARIDRSILGNMSGILQSQLLSTLQYLKLIDDNNVPQESLQSLAKAEGSERQKILKDLLRSAYTFMFPPTFNNLQNAPPRMLEEQFEKQNVSGDTIRKSLAFFLFACRDAGIPISPHVKLARRAPRRNTATRPRKVNGGGSAVSRSEPEKPTASAERSVFSDLLAKFPTFDPAWPDEVKTKWFDAFDRLMKTVQNGR